MQPLPSATDARAGAGTPFDAYRERIQRHILRLVHDPTEAEDLTQETLLRACARQSDLLNRSALEGWLFRIATNVCTDRLRQSARLKSVLPPRNPEAPDPGELPAPDPDAPSLLEALERSEMSACVQDFISGLPDRYRTVILLHDLEGLSGAEVAALLGCSLETVKIRLHRARKRLKSALAGGCEFSRDRRGVFVCDRKTTPRPMR